MMKDNSDIATCLGDTSAQVPRCQRPGAACLGRTLLGCPERHAHCIVSDIVGSHGILWLWGQTAFSSSYSRTDARLKSMITHSHLQKLILLSAPFEILGLQQFRRLAVWGKLLDAQQNLDHWTLIWVSFIIVTSNSGTSGSFSISAGVHNMLKVTSIAESSRFAQGCRRKWQS